MPLTTPSLDRDDVRKVVRGWVRLLAEGRYEDAARVLVPVGRVIYSAESLMDAVGRYSRAYREARSDEERKRLLPRVSDPDQMEETSENLELYPPATDGSAMAEYDIPLNGRWSDLTASFCLVPTGDGYVLGLYDLHVL